MLNQPPPMPPPPTRRLKKAFAQRSGALRSFSCEPLFLNGLSLPSQQPPSSTKPLRPLEAQAQAEREPVHFEIAERRGAVAFHFLASVARA